MQTTGTALKNWAKKIGTAVGVLFLLLAALIVDFLRHGGQFKTLQPHFAGSCATLPLDASAEDIQIDRARGLAYLSYLDRRAQVEGKAVTGTIMLLDLNVAEPRPRAALTTEPADFHPHGLSLYRTGDGSQRLFVISHPGKQSADQAQRVEIFEQSATGAFAPARTIRDPSLFKPNAILAVGLDQFYIANDSGASDKFQRAQELLLRRGMSTLLYFDGKQMRVIDRDIKSAAGIGMSPDGGTVYVSETSGNRLRVYTRNAANGDLALQELIELGSAPDNINVNADGTVWIAAHAKTVALIRHFTDARHLAPSQIFKLDPRAPRASRLTEIYLNAGEQISAGSVGAVYNKTLLVGSITERKILNCRMY